MTLPRVMGIVFQAVVLGSLLFLAIGKLVALGTASRVFVYQGF